MSRLARPGRNDQAGSSRPAPTRANVALARAVAWASPALAQTGRAQYDAADIQRKVQKSISLQKPAANRGAGVQVNDEDGSQAANAYLDGMRRHIEQAVRLTEGSGHSTGPIPRRRKIRFRTAAWRSW